MRGRPGQRFLHTGEPLSLCEMTGVQSFHAHGSYCHLTGRWRWEWASDGRLDGTLLGGWAVGLRRARCRRQVRLVVCKLDGQEPDSVSGGKAEGVLDVSGLRC